MLYISTRGHADRKHFCDILLEGLAPDGGLYLPEHYPQVSDAMLTKLRKAYHEQGYAELAFQILSLYIDDIPAADLKALCAKTYTAEVFGTGEIVPLRHLEDGLWLEALSNGPTLAFKDMAMQLLGNLFEYELGRRGEQLNILGATSGDTGSAAEYAMRGKKGVRVFMLSPHGRMSPFQQAQMFSLMDENIHNIAIEGVFDDCQDIVKNVSNDLDFKRDFKTVGDSLPQVPAADGAEAPDVLAVMAEIDAGVRDRWPGSSFSAAETAAFLASPAASFITGTNLVVVGALTRGVQL